MCGVGKFAEEMCGKEWLKNCTCFSIRKKNLFSKGSAVTYIIQAKLEVMY